MAEGGKQRELTPSETELLKNARMMEDLVRTDGWKAYVAWLQGQIAVREAKMLTPLHDVRIVVGVGDAVLPDGIIALASQECIKGALIGLRMAASLPQSILTQAQELRQALVTELTTERKSP